MKNLLILSVSGVSGSGKSTLVKALKDFLTGSQIIDKHIYSNYDVWHGNASERQEFLKERWQWINEGAPADKSLSNDRLAKDLGRLRDGEIVTLPDDTTIIRPEGIVLVETFFGRAITAYSELLDISIYIDTPLDIAFCRKLLRDSNIRINPETGKPMTYSETVQKYLEYGMHYVFESVAKSKSTADIIIDGTLSRTEILEVALKHIKDVVTGTITPIQRH